MSHFHFVFAGWLAVILAPAVCLLSIATQSTGNQGETFKCKNLFCSSDFWIWETWNKDEERREDMETCGEWGAYCIRYQNIRLIEADMPTKSYITTKPGGHCTVWKWFEFTKHLHIVQNPPSQGMTWAVKLESFEVSV